MDRKFCTFFLFELFLKKCKVYRKIDKIFSKKWNYKIIKIYFFQLLTLINFHNSR